MDYYCSGQRMLEMEMTDKVEGVRSQKRLVIKQDMERVGVTMACDRVRWRQMIHCGVRLMETAEIIIK